MEKNRNEPDRPSSPTSVSPMAGRVDTGPVKTPRIFTSPFLLLIIATASIFLAEGVVMLLLPLLPPLSLYKEAFLDALFLSVIVLPTLYFFLFRPLKLHINERKRVESGQERLIIELKEALDKVKILSGLLPICASCKKIQDENGRWNSLEKYISERSQAEFTHSVCPECAKILYPEFS